MITSPRSRTLIAAFVALAAVAHAQQYPKQAQLPNPYRLVENWPTVPQNMNGGRWGELIRADIDPKGNIWVFHRCFNTVPPGHATCIGRGDSYPAILEFDPAGKLLKSFGVGLFVRWICVSRLWRNLLTRRRSAS